VIGSRQEAIRTLGAADLTIDLDAQDYRDREAIVDYVTQLLVAAREPDLRSSTPYLDDSGQPIPIPVSSPRPSPRAHARAAWTRS